MKKLTFTAGAILVAGVAAILSGCNDSVINQAGAVLYYKVDTIDPSAADTSDQTLNDGTTETVDPQVKELASQYDAKKAAKAKAAAEARAAAAKAAAPKLDPPLASAEDIAAAEKRVDELRGSVKKAKNGAIS